MTTLANVDRTELEAKVKDMYRAVALAPRGEFHFEMGRALAERLGYAPADLDRVPAEAIESFAGVGYHFGLAGLAAGESVLDLGSGSGMDTFIAALKVGTSGRVVGVDMTDEQRAKAERLRDRAAAIFGFSRADIFTAVKDMYTAVATAPTTPFHFPVGRAACREVGYPDEALDGLPDTAVESFAGVGYPFRAGAIGSGQIVLDIGSGSGTDAFIASRLVGPAGKVYALDMTPAMVAKLRGLAAAAGNLEVIEGNAEHVPLADSSVDVVTSNGMLNLVPDKRRAIAEIFRVLRPGGRVQIADIVIGRPVTPDCAADPKLWAECVVGATVDEEYLEMFRDAGFTDVAVLREADYFSHSRSADTREVARSFRARAVEIAMRRGERAPSAFVRIARRLDPRRVAAAIERRGLSGTVALGLAALSCYGTLAAIAILSLAGITLAVSNAAVAGVVVFFAVLAAALVGLGFRKHGSAGPSILAIAGAAIVSFALLAAYHWVLELAGFLLLAGAVFWDFRLRTRAVRGLRHRREIAHST